MNNQALTLSSDGAFVVGCIGEMSNNEVDTGTVLSDCAAGVLRVGVDSQEGEGSVLDSGSASNAESDSEVKNEVKLEAEVEAGVETGSAGVVSTFESRGSRSSSSSRSSV